MRKLTLVTTIAAALIVPFLAAPLAGAHPAPASHRMTVYVGATGGHGSSCGRTGYSTISAAVSAVATGGTVVVCKGTYAESVTITKRLTLRGQPGAIVDATGEPYAIGIAADWVTVTGMTAENADSGAVPTLSDGILTAGFVNGVPVAGNHATITGNTVKNNIGSGIDVNSSSYSKISHNRAVNNGVGINVADDFGLPAAHNTMTANVSNDNPGGCGFALADHTGAGVYDNWVVGNIANDNGLGSPTGTAASAGSGVILAAPIPAGQMHDNHIIANTFNGNGHGGVTVHAHAPGGDFSGNVVAGNSIGTNNLRGDTADQLTTGIYLADASPMTIAIVGNHIHDNHYGIFTAGPVTVTGGAANHYAHVAVKRGSVPTYP